MRIRVYPGQYYDQETGLHYNWHRDYYPAAGRYVESDPVGVRGDIAIYTYSLNNPGKFTDPMGLAVWICNRRAEGLIGMVVGVIGDVLNI